MTNLERDLKQWLECERTQLMGKFLDYGGTRAIHRGGGDIEFAYIPGSRRDRVLLVAHTDTVWDAHSGFPAPVSYKDGVFRSGSPHLGIGADDRAGCAMLWHLRNLGHSLLLTSGEENGCRSSHWIMEQNRDVAKSIQDHRFLVQFDRSGACDFKCYSVGTPAFREYVRVATGYEEPDQLSNTDIVVLARKVCGVNLSVGYYLEHTTREQLVFEEWKYTLDKSKHWLSGENLPKFERDRSSWNNRFLSVFFKTTNKGA